MDYTNHYTHSLPHRMNSALALKDYAVSRGLTVPENILRILNDSWAILQASGEEKLVDKDKSKIGVDVDWAISELSKMTYPTTLDSLIVSARPVRSVVYFKWSLPILSLLSLSAAVWSYRWDPPGRTSHSILALMLGLLGALVYQIFNVIGVIREKAFTIEDVYTNTLRLILGPILGWIFYFSFSRAAFDNAGAPVSGNPTQQASLLLLLVPFVVGFSTKLVVGIMEQIIRAVMLIFGIEDKRTEIILRQRRNQEGRLNTPTPPSR